MNGITRSYFGGWSGALLLALLTLPLSAQEVLDVSIGEMTHQAGTIFVGTVLSAEGGLDAHGDIVTWSTFRVDQPIKGARPGEMRTIKQLGGSTPEMTMELDHMRYFEQGDRVLVLFYPESALGFTSPIGLSQGVFDLHDDGMVSGLTPAAITGIDAGILARYDLANGVPEKYPMERLIALVSELR